MDWQSFVQLFQKGENNKLKFFKSERSDNHIATTVVAMANTSGGDIFIGFDINNCHLVGVHQDASWWQSYLSKHCSHDIDFSISELFRNEKTMLRLTVNEGKHKPYYFNSKCFVMDASQSVLALFEEEKMMKKQTELQLGDMNNAQSVGINLDSNHDESIHATDETDLLDEVNTVVKEEYKVHDQVSKSTYVIQSNSLNQTESVGSVKVINQDVDLNMMQRVNIKLLLRKEGLNKRQVKVMNYLQVNDSIKNKEYREIFGVSHKTAHLELSDLVNREFLTVEGAGRSTCYRLSSDFHSKLVLSSQSQSNAPVSV